MVWTFGISGFINRYKSHHKTLKTFKEHSVSNASAFSLVYIINFVAEAEQGKAMPATEFPPHPNNEFIT